MWAQDKDEKEVRIIQVAVGFDSGSHSETVSFLMVLPSYIKEPENPIFRFREVVWSGSKVVKLCCDKGERLSLGDWLSKLLIYNGLVGGPTWPIWDKGTSLVRTFYSTGFWGMLTIWGRFFFIILLNSMISVKVRGGFISSIIYI